MFLFWVWCWIRFTFNFFISNFDCGKNFIIFDMGNNSMIDVDDKKDILILGEGPKQGLEDT